MTTQPIVFIIKLFNFNSHAHVERDKVPKLVINPSYISTHTLTWSVTGGIIMGTTTTKISTHTLTWSVTKMKTSMKMRTKISTHTLTWSVTASASAFCSSSPISTHTLTWSVTLDVVYIWCLLNVMRTSFFI